MIERKPTLAAGLSFPPALLCFPSLPAGTRGSRQPGLKYEPAPSSKAGSGVAAGPRQSPRASGPPQAAAAAARLPPSPGDASRRPAPAYRGQGKGTGRDGEPKKDGRWLALPCSGKQSEGRRSGTRRHPGGGASRAGGDARLRTPPPAPRSGF